MATFLNPSNLNPIKSTTSPPLSNSLKSLTMATTKSPNLPSPLRLLLLLTLTSVSNFPLTSAVDFEFSNGAAGTSGGARFDSEIGVDYSKQVLSDSAAFIWSTFDQPNDIDRKTVSLVTGAVESIDGVAYTAANGIHVSENYIANFAGDVKTEITGVLYHESTHVWQWDGQGQAPSGLIEGLADYVRLKAGFEPLDGHWVRPGQGDRWDQGYDVTARFLDYCEGLDSGFVAKLNGKMKDGYSDDFFVELLGKTPDQLFGDYKAKYAA